MRTAVVTGVLLSLVTLAGCTYYYAPGVSLEQAVRDCEECHHEADKATASQPSNSMAAHNSAELVFQCMKLRGYGLYFEDRLPPRLPQSPRGKSWCGGQVKALASVFSVQIWVAAVGYAR